MSYLINLYIYAFVEIQVSTVESSLREISDIFDINATKGLSQEVIKKLPKYNFYAVNTCGESQEVTCAICLQVTHLNVYLYTQSE